MSAAAQVARGTSTGRRFTAKLIKPLTRPLRKDRNRLPIPHVHIVVRDTHQCRLLEHYHTTLRDNLMYMSYVHEPHGRKPMRPIRPKFDPEDPYVKHRFNPPIGPPAWVRTPMPPVTPENIVQLECIQLHMMVKESIASKSNLLGPIMAFRAISGESERAGGRHTVEGVKIVKGKKAIGGWVKKGLATGVKVDIRGPKMYDFLGTLVNFVFPRLREFDGIPMPNASVSLETPSASSGVVSFGLGPESFSMFPQIEVNQDRYPKTYGMHIHLITNAQGVGAQNRARQLLSGFQVPFSRR